MKGMIFKRPLQRWRCKRNRHDWTPVYLVGPTTWTGAYVCCACGTRDGDLSMSHIDEPRAERVKLW